MDFDFKAAICTNCGTELKIDASKKTCFCAVCGSKISVPDAVRKFQVLFPSRAQSEEMRKAADNIAAVAAAAAVPVAPAAPAASATPEAAAPKADDSTPPEPETEAEATLKSLYEKAQQHLNSREYIKASDIYSKIINEIDSKEHAAYWGLFLVDERNFNIEEKLLQCYSCFPFRGGVETIRKEILNNQNLDKALNHASAEERKFYNEEVVKYSDNLYNVYREGIDNLTAISERRYDILCNTFETVGISAAASRIGYPAGVGIKLITDKFYFQFSTNRMAMLHMDVLSVASQPTPTYTFWHYRHVMMNPDNGVLSWSEFRNFRNCSDPALIFGELDSFHKIGFVLLGVWRDKLIVRTGNKVYFCRTAPQQEEILSIFQRCYQATCVPIVEDPNSWNTGQKASEFYQVAPISANYETSKKSKWVRKKVAGCYIATAVYGDYDAPQVLTLRRFRDNVLLNSRHGRAFVRAYYRLSPPLAKKLTPHSRLTRLIRSALDKIVSRLSGEK